MLDRKLLIENTFLNESNNSANILKIYKIALQ